MPHTKKHIKLWTIKNGRKIHIRDMTNKHLINTVAFLYKTAKLKAKMEEHLILSFPSPTGDIAEYLWEQGVDDIIENGIDECEYLPPIYYDMVNELEKRKLRKL